MCAPLAAFEDLKGQLAQTGCGDLVVQLFERCHQADEPETRPTMAEIHDQLQLLLMQTEKDQAALNRELDKILAHRDNYDRTWEEHYAGQPAMPALLLYVEQLGRGGPKPQRKGIEKRVSIKH